MSQSIEIKLDIRVAKDDAARMLPEGIAEQQTRTTVEVLPVTGGWVASSPRGMSRYGDTPEGAVGAYVKWLLKEWFQGNGRIYG